MLNLVVIYIDNIFRSGEKKETGDRRQEMEQGVRRQETGVRRWKKETGDRSQEMEKGVRRQESGDRRWNKETGDRRQ
ncbi:hypothetical protein, partial [Okeania sp. SIO1H2]|uniref:hypothetical protein n=1 Tax=Okeania sp. SIO1H2 TaxID=2607775 RepID=UPI00141C86DD